MKTRPVLLLVAVAASFGGAWALRRAADSRPAGGPARAAPTRIVSLAPSVTEVLFLLGLGDRVVGVTRYCEFPPEARTRPQIGGYDDPNYEALVQSRPDLVVTLPEQKTVHAELGRLGLRTLAVDHTTVEGILDSVTAIGDACGVAGRAAEARAGLESRLRRIAARVAGRPRRRVLVSIGRAPEDDSTTRFTACGRGGYFDGLIARAGGVNALDTDVPYPIVSAEGVIAAKPDVILDLTPETAEAEAARRAWSAIPGLKAEIHVIGGSHAVVPGPRFVQLLDDMARAIHPEARDE